MDTRLEQKKGIKKKHIPYIAAAAVLLLALIWRISDNHTPKLNVDKERVMISPVTIGEFNDYIRISGQVMPISTIQLSAIEGGMVDEKLVEEGAMVKKGDVIVKLSNITLHLNILNSESNLAERQNMLRNTQVAMEQEKLNLRRERLQLNLDVERKKRKYEQYEQLYNENLISKEGYLLAKEDYEFSVDSRTLIIERQAQDSIYRSIQLEMLEEDLLNMRVNLDLIRQREECLNVKAPVDGQLGLLGVEIGQNIYVGGKIGQISVLSDFKVEASIDEHYIDRVKEGLEATFERQDKNFALMIRKVYPEVREKLFKTDFIFTGERPDNIRAGQTYSISLQLGQPIEAVMIPRGTFYQTTGGRWIYVMSADGNTATRRDIVIGRQNPSYYEVLEGLKAGEQVITSSYDDFGDAEQLVFK